MLLSQDFLNQILECKWLCKCGTQYNFEFDVEYLSNWKEAEKHINSTRWENFCLERMGDFTVYLFQNNKEEYNNYWNRQIDIIKKEYMPIIVSRIENVLNKKRIPISILDDIQMNVLSLFMIEYYSDYYSSEFYENLLEIYLSGHLPCDWRGDFPGGRYIIY